MLRKHGAYTPEPGWGRVSFAVTVACAAMVAALYWQYGELSAWLDSSARYRAAQLFVLIALGVAVYGAMLAVAGLRPRHLAKGSA